MYACSTISALILIGVCCATAHPDTVRTVVGKEVTVLAESNDLNWRVNKTLSSNISVDNVMRVGGITLLQRANGFAGEASLNGLRGAQLTATIDGMKIHAACVDKMDPATAYLEVDNLSEVAIRSDGSDLRYGQTLGGAVSFTLKQPSLASPVTTMADVSLESNSMAKRIRAEISGGGSNYGLRAGYTLRDNDNMVAGGNNLLEGSGFTKHNLNIGGRWLPSSDHEILVNAIADVASDVGYPALIMDTRNATAYIGSLALKSHWSSAISTVTRLYANTVHHVMDDYDRSDTELSTRLFMPNMRMPMTGTTKVVGLIAEGTVNGLSDVVSAVVDANIVYANATMDMIPTDTSIAKMTLTNIGNAEVRTIGVSGTWDHEFNTDFSARVGARADVSERLLADVGSRSILAGYFPGVEPNRLATAFSLHLGMVYIVSDQVRVSATLARGERMPTHQEMYGFWVYDPQANITTIGRPDLKNEQSLSVETSVSYRQDNHTITSTVWMRRIDNYIAPSQVGSIDQPSLRFIENIGGAFLAGADILANLSLSEYLNVVPSLRYVYASALDVGEPLPLIPPLLASMRIVGGKPYLQGELTISAAASQKRISRNILWEDSTPSWITTDLVIAWYPMTSTRFQLSCTNVFDVRYHEHTSINNMPARGRSFNIGLRVSA